VAVQASREIVIDAPPGVILEALADVGSLSSWSPVHKRIQVLDWYSDGRPHHVKATIKIFGLVDNEILEYHWGPNWVVWDAVDTFQQRGQHVEYNLQPVGIDGDVKAHPGLVDADRPCSRLRGQACQRDRAGRRDQGAPRPGHGCLRFRATDIAIVSS
jgi:hypothetical protein